MRSTFSHKETKPLTEFGATAAQCVRRVCKSKRPLLITDRGKFAAVVLDIRAYHALVRRKALLDDIATAERQLAAGQALAHEAARARVLAHLAK